MANRHRGEVDAKFDGRSFTLCLTLGALAELEAAFGDADMLALAQRFGSGRLSANDAIRIIGAGLRGGGHDLDNETVALLTTEGGAAGFVAIVAQVLRATFGAGQADLAHVGSAVATDHSKAPAEAGNPAPFPGTT